MTDLGFESPAGRAGSRPSRQDIGSTPDSRIRPEGPARLELQSVRSANHVPETTTRNTQGTSSTRGYRWAWIGTPAGAVYLIVVAGILWEWANWALAGSFSLLRCLESVVGPLCHHQPARTPTISGRSLPVCARCTGIWFGWLAGALIDHVPAARLWPAYGRRVRWLGLVVVGALGAGLAAGESIGWFGFGNLARVGSGILLGLPAGWLLVESARGVRKDVRR